MLCIGAWKCTAKFNSGAWQEFRMTGVFADLNPSDTKIHRIFIGLNKS